jgi:hypothetical protein
VLRIARVGVTSYNGPADLPGDEPAEFLGRPWAELPSVPMRTDGNGPRREPLPGEAPHEYVGYLGEELFGELGLGDDDAQTPFGLAVAGYLSVLAVPALRDLVGWERSLDAHALGLLTAERGLRHLGEVAMTDEQEEVCFRWLHLATYVAVTPEHVSEMHARRAIRLAHARRPPGVVAMMTCEVSVEDALGFQQGIASSASTAFGRDQLLAHLDRAANAAEPGRWAVRREGFGHLGRVDLTPAAHAAEGPDYGSYLHGHLLRWIVEEDVPVRPHMLGVTGGYAASIHRRLVVWPAEKGVEAKAINSHLAAMKFVRENAPVTLADELVLLAWLMDQRGFGFRLAQFLEGRRRVMASLRGS